MKLTQRHFYILLIALHIFGFVYQVFNPDYLTLDSDDYILLAQNLWDYGIPYSGIIEPSVAIENLGNKGLFASRPILYSILILLTGGVKISPLLTLLFQNILSILSISQIEKLMKEKGFSINYAIASITLLLFPSLWIYANWIMSETLFMFLITYWLSSYLNQKFLQSSIYLTLAFLTKPAIMFIMLAWVVIYIYKYVHDRKSSLLIAAILPVLFLFFQILSNYHFTGAKITSSMPGINLVQYNAKFTLSKKYGMDSAQNWVNSMDSIGFVKEKEEGFPVSYQYKKGNAKEVIINNLGTYIMTHLQGSLRWTIDPGRFDILNFFNIYKEGGNEGWMKTYYSEGVSGVFKRALDENLLLLFVILLITSWNIIRLILFAKNCKILLAQPLLFYSFLATLIYFAAISGPVASARFLLPVFPVIWAWVSAKEAKAT